MHEQNAIKSMPLYVDVERINNELAALGIGVNEALTPARLVADIVCDTRQRHAEDGTRPGSPRSRPRI